MPTKAFNDRWLKSVKPGGATDEYTDAGCPCLTVRVGKRISRLLFHSATTAAQKVGRSLPSLFKVAQ